MDQARDKRKPRRRSRAKHPADRPRRRRRPGHSSNRQTRRPNNLREPKKVTQPKQRQRQRHFLPRITRIARILTETAITATAQNPSPRTHRRTVTRNQISYHWESTSWPQKKARFRPPISPVARFNAYGPMPSGHIQLAQRAVSNTITVKAPRWLRAQRHLGNPRLTPPWENEKGEK